MPSKPRPQRPDPRPAAAPGTDLTPILDDHGEISANGSSVISSPPHPESAPVGTAATFARSLSLRWWLVGIYAAGLLLLGLSQLGTLDEEMGHDTAHYLSLARSVARGEEFSTKTHWALNMPDDGLPRPDTYRAPLYPILVALVSFVVTDFHLAGKWVTAFCGAAIPMIVFLFARRRLHLSTPWSLTAAAIALTNHHLVLAGSRALTETPYALVALLLLYVITALRPSAVAAGVLVGLACLLRYQGVILAPVAAAAILAMSGSWRTRVRSLGVFAVVVGIMLAPWAARTYQITGSPFYTDLKYHLVSSYDPDVSYYEYFHSATALREPVDYVTARLDRTAYAVAYRLREIGSFFGRENAGNPLFFVLALVGVVAAFRWRRQFASRRVTLLVLLFAAANVTVVALTFAKSRHLTSVDPFVALFAAAGASVLVEGVGARRRSLTFLIVLALVLGMGLEQLRAVRKLARYEPTGYEAAARIAPYLTAHLEPGESVMAASPYYFSYLLDRQAVSLPWCDDDLFTSLLERFRVGYVFDAPKNPEIPSLCEASLLRREVIPAWLVAVHDEAGTDGRLYRVELTSSPNGSRRP